MSQESKERTARHIRDELEQATHVQRELEREHLPAPSGMAIARMALGETAEERDAATSECNRWMAERETAEAELHARADYQAARARVDALADERGQAEHIERMVKRGLPLRHAKLIGARALRRTEALTAAIEWEQSGASLLIMLATAGDVRPAVGKPNNPVPFRAVVLAGQLKGDACAFKICHIQVITWIVVDGPYKI